MPVAGSAYTFSYASLGGLIAWIIGWDLVLEFTVAAAALAVGFSGYLNSLSDGTPFELLGIIGSLALVTRHAVSHHADHWCRRRGDCRHCRADHAGRPRQYRDPFAFVLVSIGVVILRRTRPDLPRAFRAPAAPLVAVLAVVSCVYLMLNQMGETWVRFLVWMAIGLVVYFGYGRRQGRLAQRERASRPRCTNRVGDAYCQ